MPRGKPRGPGKEQRRRQLIDRWQRRGPSVRAFCRHRHLAVPSFCAWRRTVGQRDGGARPVTPPVTSLPVPVRPDGRDPPRPLERVPADGRRLRTPSGFDPNAFRALLAAPEGPSC